MENIPSKEFFNEQIEMSLLGIILTNNDVLEEIPDLQQEFFLSQKHQDIFLIIKTLFNQSRSADILTVADYANLSTSKYQDITFEYLQTLINSVINLKSYKEYSIILQDLYLKRKILSFRDNINTYLNNNENVEQQLSNIESELYSISEKDFNNKDVSFKYSLEQALQTVERAKNHKGSISGITTGLIDLNKKLGGLQASDLIVLAARPSMGKTALATNIAFKAAHEFYKGNNLTGTPSVIFSLEMSAEQITTRILSNYTGVSGDLLRKGMVSDGDFARFTSLSQELQNVPLFIDDTPALTVSQIRSRCRRLKRKHNIGLVIIDYIQLIGSDNKRNDNRTTEVSEITRGLKSIAKEFNIPVIALSQLSRAVEARENHMPLLSDLRESGSIEQDADIVAFIFREEYYLRRNEPSISSLDDKSKLARQKWENDLQACKDQATIIIAKNRHGSIGHVNVKFNSDTTQFGDSTTQELEKLAQSFSNR